MKSTDLRPDRKVEWDLIAMLGESARQIVESIDHRGEALLCVLMAEAQRTHEPADLLMRDIVYSFVQFAERAERLKKLEEAKHG